MGFVIASYFITNVRGVGAENFLSLVHVRVHKKYYVLISLVCLFNVCLKFKRVYIPLIRSILNVEVGGSRHNLY